MKIYIVIPAYNETGTITEALNSIVTQTQLPDKLVLVNDNSTDDTGSIMIDYAKEFDWIEHVDRTSAGEHLPGAKVIEAFNTGLSTLDKDYDIICKFDADIVFPEDYIARLRKMFEDDPVLGIAGGIPYIKNNGQWVFERIASKDHVRGPIKAYRKACFRDIGGLRRSVGWDTIDVLLAQYHGWKVRTDKDLHVRHLKPTGMNYQPKARYLQGKALYKMRYGIVLSTIALIKGALARGSIMFFIYGLAGFLKAFISNESFLITKVEGHFFRGLRWKNIRLKLNPIRKTN
ncbi:MAG: glycosyltransferase family 2 protein [Flavobacteriaceae bacterium]|nr:glycosyltransferase family 2 protein [Flavobacteriaceae bacterium]